MLVHPPDNPRNYSGLSVPIPPDNCYKIDLILKQAQEMLEDRERRYPFLIAQNAIDDEFAMHDIETFKWIVQDWLWIAQGNGAPAPHSTLADRIAALDRSIKTIADILRENGALSSRMEWKANLVVAMRWHLETEHQPHDIYYTTHAARSAFIGPISPRHKSPEPIMIFFEDEPERKAA